MNVSLVWAGMLEAAARNHARYSRFGHGCSFDPYACDQERYSETRMPALADTFKHDCNHACYYVAVWFWHSMHLMSTYCNHDKNSQ